MNKTITLKKFIRQIGCVFFGLHSFVYHPEVSEKFVFCEHCHAMRPLE